MTVVVWVTEDTWQACVDAARSLAPPDAGITLLAVVDSATAETAHGAFSGLLGRSGAGPSHRLLARAEKTTGELLDRAQARLGRDAGRLQLNGQGKYPGKYPGKYEGRHEGKHEIAAAVSGATMLIVARDGRGPGPRSLGKDVRFVVDHAPCPVLLIWPGPPPPVPPPPGHSPRPGEHPPPPGHATGHAPGHSPGPPPGHSGPGGSPPR